MVNKIDLLSDGEFIELISNSSCISDVLRTLGYSTNGNSWGNKIVKERMEKLNLTFKKQNQNYYGKDQTRLSMSEILTKDSGYSRSRLKERLVEEGLKEYKCECCGLTEWMGKPIVLQLHHIDGNHDNNNLENLQLLCPNCHSQTENYCGNANSSVEKYYCKDCGSEITRGSTYCTICAAKHRRKVEKPSLEQLIEDFKELKAFTKIGNKYGVKDNSVKKWFISYDLPGKVKELKEYIDLDHSLKLE